MRIALVLSLVVLLSGLVMGQGSPAPPVKQPPYGIDQLKAPDTAHAGNSFQVGPGGTVVTGTAKATSGVNFENSGDVSAFGHFREQGQGRKFDTSYIHVERALKSMSITKNIVKKLNGGSWLGTAADSMGLHPGAVYFPGGILGHELISTFSLYTGPPIYEMTFLRVSDDEGLTWNYLTSGTDTCPDPLMAFNQMTFLGKNDAHQDTVYHSINSSDPELVIGSDRRLWCAARVGFDTTAAQRHGTDNGSHYFCQYFLTGTSDGIIWSTPKVIVADSFAMGQSPAITLEQDGTYSLWSIKVWSSSGNFDSSRIYHATATYIDSAKGTVGGWTYKPGWVKLADPAKTGIGSDTLINFPKGDTLWNGSFRPWHLDVVDNGSGQKFFLYNGFRAYGGDFQDSTKPWYAEFIGVSEDGGNSIAPKWAPIITPSYQMDHFDASCVYRPTGWVKNRGGYSVLRYMYSGYANASYRTDGNLFWGTGITDIVFGQPIYPGQIQNLVIDTGAYKNSSVNISKINWPEEYWEIPVGNVYGRDTILAPDSVAMALSRFTGQTAATRVRWMLSDSTFDVSNAERDTFQVTYTSSFPVVMDSFAYDMIVANTGAKIDSVSVSNANPKALSADTVITTDNTDRTSTSRIRVVITLGKSVSYPDAEFVATIVTAYNANSNGKVRIGHPTFIGHRRQ